MDNLDLLRGRFSLLEFIRLVRQDTRQLQIGRHTLAITKRIDKAVYDFEHGISTYLIVTIPFRHGKSEIISRHFPPFFLGRNPNAEIILSTYGQGLSNEMSRYARNIVKRSTEYHKLFPHITLSKASSSVQTWALDGYRGKFQAITISAGGTCRGADVLIIDDYLRGRSVAESSTIRESQWDNFAGNLMSRLAPVHIAIILATPWHPDDIIGRIKRRIDPEDECYDPNFPKFEVMKFPARNRDGSYLWPDRFGEDWYLKQFASLGVYQSAALLQCEPTIRGGMMLKTDGIKIEDEMPANLRWIRFWDLASGVKELVKDDPDSSAGAKVAVRKEKGLWHLYVDDFVFCQAEAPERNRLIESTAIRDGASVLIGVESVAGYKDTYSIMKRVLAGRFTVVKINVSRDKVVRAGEVAPLFDVGNVHFRKAWWNKQVIEQIGEFPSGRHDDYVDALAGGYAMAISNVAGSRAILAT